MKVEITLDSRIEKNTGIRLSILDLYKGNGIVFRNILYSTCEYRYYTLSLSTIQNNVTIA